MSIISVKEHGARGDGQSDDTVGIQRATALLQPADTLYFPGGTYRVSTPGTLVSVQGISKLKVFFDAGAVLLMDNLDQQGLGSGHAFYFRGYADGLVLEGIRIRWKTMPTQRSMGDGIRLDGPFSSAGPSDQRTIRNVIIRRCHVAQAPQAGIVLMGCSDIVIEDIEIVETWADGVHLNACRRFTINNITGLNVRDDHVALVTYYDPSTLDYALGNREGGPYTQPALGEWSNYRGKISNVHSNATRRLSANGIRVAGALDVRIENLRAHLRKAAIIIDAGKKGNTYGWEYQASQKIQVHQVNASECHVGVHVMTFNALSTDTRYWNFEVSLDELRLVSCELDNLLIEKCSGVAIGHVESHDGRIRMINLNNVRVDRLHNSRGHVWIHGLSALARSSAINPVPPSNISINTLTVKQGEIQLANARHLTVGDLRVEDGLTETGCTLVNVREATVGSLVSRFAQQCGVRIINCQSLIILSALIETNKPDFTSVAIEGGNASSVSENITLVSVVYQGISDQPDVQIQQGKYAPRQVSARLLYGKTSQSSAKQKHYKLK